MIWPLIDPINASTKSSSKLTAATPPANVHTPWNVGGRPEEATHPAIADVWRLYEATLPRGKLVYANPSLRIITAGALFCDFAPAWQIVRDSSAIRSVDFAARCNWKIAGYRGKNRWYREAGCLEKSG